MFQGLEGAVLSSALVVFSLARGLLSSVPGARCLFYLCQTLVSSNLSLGVYILEFPTTALNVILVLCSGVPEALSLP